jgi:hypothetical protein
MTFWTNKTHCLANEDMSIWRLVYDESHIPKQDNSFDCGLFLIARADFISDNLPLCYKQTDMNLFRCKVGTDIINGTLSYRLIGFDSTS